MVHPYFTGTFSVVCDLCAFTEVLSPQKNVHLWTPPVQTSVWLGGVGGGGFILPSSSKTLGSSHLALLFLSLQHPPEIIRAMAGNRARPPPPGHHQTHTCCLLLESPPLTFCTVSVSSWARFRSINNNLTFLFFTFFCICHVLCHIFI